MIYLYTGLNGTGKTSNVLWMFLNAPEYKDRPKYATAIRGFDYEKWDVTKLDLEGLRKWYDCPVGSVFLVDEAQDFFPAERGHPAEWIANLAKNRHDGFDFLLTTPNAAMINHFVRNLVNRHTHFVMKHGAMVSALKWDKAQKDPDSSTSKASGEPQKFKTPKEVFQLYTSTQLDTRQVKPPTRTLITIGVCAVLIIGTLFYMFSLSGLFHKSEKEKPALAAHATVSASSFAMPHAAGLPGSAPVHDAAYYTPRNPLDPATAPEYDALTQPTDFRPVFPSTANATVIRSRERLGA